MKVQKYTKLTHNCGAEREADPTAEARQLSSAPPANRRPHLVCVRRVVADVDLQCAGSAHPRVRKRVQLLRRIHSSPQSFLWAEIHTKLYLLPSSIYFLQ